MELENNFPNFLTAHFNDRTVERQIKTNEERIKTLLSENENLKKIEITQLETPWYLWKNVVFGYESYESNHSYRDLELGTEVFKDYSSFVSDILKYRFRHLFPPFFHTDKSYFVITPNQEKYIFSSNEELELPFVKEFVEYIKNKEQLNTEKKKVSEIESSCEILKNKINQKSVFTDSHIECLKIELKQLERKLTDLFKANSDNLNKLEKSRNKLFSFFKHEPFILKTIQL